MDSSARTQIIPVPHAAQSWLHQSGPRGFSGGQFGLLGVVKSQRTLSSFYRAKSQAGIACQAVGEVGSTSVASGAGTNRLVLIMVVTAALGGLLFGYYR